MVDFSTLKYVRDGQLTRLSSTELGFGRIPVGSFHLLIEALEKNPRVDYLDLSEKLGSARLVEDVAHALQGNQALSIFSLSENRIDDQAAAALAQALRGKTTLTEVDFSHCDLSDESASLIFDALATCPNLLCVNMQKAEIGEKATASIIRLLQHTPQLEELDILNAYVQIPDKHLLAIAAALPDCRNLVSFSATGLGARFSAETIGELDKLAQTGYRPNLFVCAPPRLYDLDARKRNNELAKKTNDMLLEHQEDYSGMPATDVAIAADMLPLIHYILPSTAESLKAHLTRFNHYLDALPQVDLSAPVTAENLTQHNATGRCALENPRTWHHLDRLLEQADASVDGALFKQCNAQGESYLSIGLAAAPDKVIPALNKHGIKIDRTALLANRKASPEFTRIMERDALRYVFSLDNFGGQSSDLLRESYSLLSQEQKTQVHGFHVLLSELNASEGRGRGR